MKTNIIIRSAKWAFMLICLVLLFSCTDPDLIGLQVQPAKDKFTLLYDESSKVIAYTVREDSIRSDKTVLNLLGNYDDPIFGRTASSIYTQIRLSSNNVDFGPSPVADSIVLSLAYKGYYGKLRKVNIKVSEILDDFYKDTTYYSNKTLNISNQPLANITIVPTPTDSVTVEGHKMAPQLRIRLDQSLAQKFIDESASVNVSDNVHFLQFFKGLNISTSFVNTEGSVLYFDLISAISQVTLYYKNDNNDSLKYNFVIDANCARFNSFNHYNYLNANNSLKQQINGDSLLGDSLLYVQAMSGLKVKLMFPDFKTFFEGKKIALNKAELIIPVEYDPTQSNYALPDKLTLVRLNENKQIAYLIDQFEGDSHFRGEYDATNNQYSFTITRHIQNIILNNIKDYGLYLMVSGSGINAGRVLLKGPKRSDKKMILKLTYTKL